jgi:SAM-dependent methyltransferase
MLKNVFLRISQESREKRRSLFRYSFNLNENTRILDLGSENGAHINRVLEGSLIKKENVFIADICEDFLDDGVKKFGYSPVLIPANGRLPFDDNYFDIVFCSSVIEHVTIEKEKIWKCTSSEQFKNQAYRAQKNFAREITRLGKAYYVQTPNRDFPIESHTWLPFISYLPRPSLVKILNFSNKFWIKKTNPDWNLLNERQMKEFFPDSKIYYEKYCGLVKSLIAIKNVSN